MRLAYLVVVLIALSAGGCATITSSEYQPVSISTYDSKGAPLQKVRCQLQNDKGSWELQAPGYAQVHRSSEDLLVQCRKDGHPDGSARAVSRVAAGMFGNIVFGGGVGALIDHTKGTGYNYPDALNIRMGSAMVFDRRDADDAPAPAVYASASPQSTAAAAPPPVPSIGEPADAKVAARLPHRGDMWKYRYRDGYGGMTRETLVHEVLAVDGERIDERMYAEGRAAFADVKSFAPASALGFAQRPLAKSQRTEFSPYLAAFHPELAGGFGQRIAGLANDGRWQMSARVIGREIVVVPAGSFDAFKIEIAGEQPARSLIGEPVRLQHIIWYAPAAKRYVRYEVNSWNFNGAPIDKDRFELVEFRLQ